MPHLELNLAPTAEDMPDMALERIRAIIAAADHDRDETTVLLTRAFTATTAGARPIPTSRLAQPGSSASLPD